MLTVAEIAQRVGITRQAVNWHIRHGNLHARMFGRTHLVNEDDYQCWLEWWQKQRNQRR